MVQMEEDLLKGVPYYFLAIFHENIFYKYDFYEYEVPFIIHYHHLNICFILTYPQTNMFYLRCWIFWCLEQVSRCVDRILLLPYLPPQTSIIFSTSSKSRSSHQSSIIQYNLRIHSLLSQSKSKSIPDVQFSSNFHSRLK